jgi:protein phosphatase
MSIVVTPEYAGLTDVGRRENNEDSLATPQGVSPAATDASGWLFVVADGVGGHASGQVASAVAAKAAPEAYYQAPPGDTAAALERAVKLANEQVRQLAVQPENHGMATTLVAAVVQGDRLTVANVGDSRAYLYRGGRLRQITNDHSWVAEQVRLRVLTPEQAANHPYRNMISRALGQNADVAVDIFHERLRPGDQVLLCSDGLHGAAPDSDIERVLATSESSALAARRLVDLALEKGGSDNITVVVVRAPLGTGQASGPWVAGGLNACLPKAALVVVAVALGGVLLLAFLVWAGGTGPATPMVTPAPTQEIPASPTTVARATATLAVRDTTPSPTGERPPAATSVPSPANTPTPAPTVRPTVLPGPRVTLPPGLGLFTPPWQGIVKAKDGVSVRRLPDAASAGICILRQNTVVLVTGQTEGTVPANETESLWYKVQYDNSSCLAGHSYDTVGFVFAYYIGPR